jgi:hypothetical protein
MKIVGESQLAFDTQAVGFPSLSGCLGLVYQTNAGLYGYHLYGGNDARAADRAKLFAEFVDGHGTGQAGTRLYGVCFIQKRGWLGSDGFAADRTQAWKQEIAIYANALVYTGKITGFNLSKHYGDSVTSAYAEFRKVGSKCDLWVRKWSDPVDKPKASSGANPNRADHIQIMKRKAGIVSEDLATVYTSVPTDNLVKVSKQKLSG